MNKKPHGNIGNKNAAKNTPFSDVVYIRLTPTQRKKYADTAAKTNGGMNLQDWMRLSLDAASDCN